MPGRPRAESCVMFHKSEKKSRAPRMSKTTALRPTGHDSTHPLAFRTALLCENVLYIPLTTTPSLPHSRFLSFSASLPQFMYYQDSMSMCSILRVCVTSSTSFTLNSSPPPLHSSSHISAILPICMRLFSNLPCVLRLFCRPFDQSYHFYNRLYSSMLPTTVHLHRACMLPYLLFCTIYP